MHNSKVIAFIHCPLVLVIRHHLSLIYELPGITFKEKNDFLEQADKMYETSQANAFIINCYYYYY